MNRRLKSLFFCLALLAAAVAGAPAQDTGGGGGGDTGAGSSSSGEGSSGSDDNGTLTPAPGANALGGGQPQQQQQPGMQQQNGTESGTPPANGEENPGANSETTPVTPPPGSESPSEIIPGPAFTLPTQRSLLPGSSSASPPSGGNAMNAGVLSAPAPITLSLPGGYGTAGQTFTLGQGRLSRPPVLFTLSISAGLDSNITAVSTVQPVAEVKLSQKVQFREASTVSHIGPPFPVTPVPGKVVTETITTGTIPARPGQKPVASGVVNASLGIQIQEASPRTVLTLDANLGALDYSKETQLQYTGALGINFIHRLTPRATFTASVDDSYQNQPDFSRINTPTSNATGPYLSANSKFDITYAWSDRFSTVTSWGVSLVEQQSNKGNNTIGYTYGNQFRYTVSARETLTTEIRQQQSTYPSITAQDNTQTFYLVGLDSIVSAHLRNTFSTGIVQVSYPSANTSSGSTSSPYFESDTTLALPRGGGVQWTNRYGLESDAPANVKETSYRTTLSLSEPLGAKLSASVSIAYNHIAAKDKLNALANSTQDEFQGTLALNYTVNPKFSLNLSYTYIDFLDSFPNSSYGREQIFLGGTYTF